MNKHTTVTKNITLTLTVQVRVGREEEDAAYALNRYKIYGPYATNEHRDDVGVLKVIWPRTTQEQKSTSTCTSTSSPSDTEEE